MAGGRGVGWGLLLLLAAAVSTCWHAWASVGGDECAASGGEAACNARADTPSRLLVGSFGERVPVKVYRVSAGPSPLGGLTLDGSAPADVDVGTRPSWVAAHPTAPGVAYAVNENFSRSNGTVVAIVAGRAGPAVSSGGAGPTHCAVSPGGEWLAVANYGARHGEVAVAAHPLDPASGLPLAPPPGGPYTYKWPRAKPSGAGEGGEVGCPRWSHVGLAEWPHPHGVAFNPRVRGVLYVPALGAGRVVQARISGGGGLEDIAPPYPLPWCSGPRHAAAHPHLNVLYVVTEFSKEVFALALSSRGGAVVSTLGAVRLMVGKPEDDDAATGAEVAVHPSGRWLLASVRVAAGPGGGAPPPGRLLVFPLGEGAGALGPRPVVEGGTPSGGSNPRSFIFSPGGETVFVANQGGEGGEGAAIATFRFDASSGRLEEGAAREVAYPATTLALVHQ